MESKSHNINYELCDMNSQLQFKSELQEINLQLQVIKSEMCDMNSKLQVKSELQDKITRYFELRDVNSKLQVKSELQEIHSQ